MKPRSGIEQSQMAWSPLEAAQEKPIETIPPVEVCDLVAYNLSSYRSTPHY